jgi:uncharacterized protein DUF262
MATTPHPIELAGTPAETTTTNFGQPLTPTLREISTDLKFVIPPYQRAQVWTATQKSALLDALYRGLPVPAPLVYPSDKDRYAILDGQQRLTTIQHFYDKENPFKIGKVPTNAIPQELQAMAKGSALLDGREEVNEDDLNLVRRVAFDCIPPARRQVLAELVRQAEGREVPGVLGEGSPGRTTTHYARQEMEELGLLEERGLSAGVVKNLRAAGIMT